MESGLNYSGKNVLACIVLTARGIYNAFATSLTHPNCNFEIDSDTGNAVNVLPPREYARMVRARNLRKVSTNVMEVYDKVIGDPQHREEFEKGLRRTLDGLL